MGLRELNAARTRRHIADVALDLFLEYGYEETRMEEVAKRAEVGTSTLYRYFPTKESLTIAAIGEPRLMADTLLSRPDDESVEIGLGYAITAVLSTGEEGEIRARKFQDLVSRNPRLNPQLLSWLEEASRHLRTALAARTGASADDGWIGATAWLVIFVLQRVNEINVDGSDSVAIARQVTRELGEYAILLPRIAPR